MACVCHSRAARAGKKKSKSGVGKCRQPTTKTQNSLPLAAPTPAALLLPFPVTRSRIGVHNPPGHHPSRAAAPRSASNPSNSTTLSVCRHPLSSYSPGRRRATATRGRTDAERRGRTGGVGRMRSMILIVEGRAKDEKEKRLHKQQRQSDTPRRSLTTICSGSEHTLSSHTHNARPAPPPRAHRRCLEPAPRVSGAARLARWRPPRATRAPLPPPRPPRAPLRHRAGRVRRRWW